MPAAIPLPRGPSVLTLYSAADLLTAPGCPVCRYATEASARYLGWFALEGHSQPANLTRLCASLGLCGPHTRRLMAQPGAAVRLTAVYRYVLTAARDRLTGRNGRLPGCPACEHDDAAAGRALETLVEGLADTAVLDQCRELGGVCLPHLAAASTATSSRVASELAETVHELLALRGARCEWLAGTDHDAETRVLLRRALAPTGVPGPVPCWPCLSGAQAERDELARLPDRVGGGPDPGSAMCALHLADAAIAAGPDAIRPLLAWQARSLTTRLQDAPSRRLRLGSRWRAVSPECTVCRARRAAGQRALADFRSDPRVRTIETPLCARHLISLRDADPGVSKLLTASAIAHCEQLIGELADSFERTTRAHGHGTSAGESSSWRRAAVFLDGAVYGGCPPRLAAPA